MRRRKPNWYHFRTFQRRGQYACVKLDESFEILDVYFLEDLGFYVSCDCVAGSMQLKCRHVQMLELWRKHQAFNKRLVYDYRNEVWTGRDTLIHFGKRAG